MSPPDKATAPGRGAVTSTGGRATSQSVAPAGPSASRRPNRYTEPEAYGQWQEQRDAKAKTERTAAPDTYEMVDRVIERLAERNVFQRSAGLVMITREARRENGTTRPDGAPTIRTLPQPRLAEIIATMAAPELLALAKGEYEEELAACETDEDRLWLTADWETRQAKALQRAAQIGNQHAVTILARGEWAHIRPLTAIVSYPVMRPDGSIVTASGYDDETGTIAEMTVSVDVPDQPTIDDARAALNLLADLVQDFPFANPGHLCAWIAALLTVVARPAIDGPTPMLLIDATARGSGKGLLADVATLITLGARATVRTAPKTREEWDKTMLALLSAGDPIVLLDNLVGMLSSDALEMVLTAQTYTQRVLGVSETRTVPIRTVFMATANNVRLSTDLVRRSLHCRLEPQCESPEHRPESDFTHADLRGHVKEHRARYLSAALTIVKAYAVAGRPRVEAKPMGSFQEWARVVRDALVWAGGEDPVATQAGLREQADVERDELTDLLREWHALLGDRLVTAAELLEAAKSGRAPGATKAQGKGFLARATAGRGEGLPLLDALHGIMPDGKPPTAHLVGNRLRSRRGQIVGGLVLRPGPTDHHHGTRYQVVRL